MEHMMKLNPVPFEMIKNRIKTIELRLYDEKRQKIKVGDSICFYNTESFEKIMVIVEELFVFETFEELYKELPLEECGYVKQELSKAKAEDMFQYYSVDKQKQYGIVGIKVKFI